MATEEQLYADPLRTPKRRTIPSIIANAACRLIMHLKITRTKIRRYQPRDGEVRESVIGANRDCPTQKGYLIANRLTQLAYDGCSCLVCRGLNALLEDARKVGSEIPRLHREWSS
jgi:hypothetical protein